MIGTGVGALVMRPGCRARGLRLSRADPPGDRRARRALLVPARV